MKKTIIIINLVLSCMTIWAQTSTTRLVEKESDTGISYARVVNQRTTKNFYSSNNGLITVEGQNDDTLHIHALGYADTTLLLGLLSSSKTLKLRSKAIELDEVELTIGKNNLGVQKMDLLNLKLTPINNAQDLLTTINGVFIAQHAGGGKAEQIFLRGFDNDHGTDFGIFYDDIPVNLSNHAHGQGYADMHFIIPEVIETADYYKGLYEPKNGNFVVSGAARYKTKNSLSSNLLKLDIGDYGFRRGLMMIDITPKNVLFSKNKYERAYIALERTSNDGYFDSPQDFKKTNATFKYNAELNRQSTLTVMGSYFDSDWNASGQIPLRAVNTGLISWFGAIDDLEGGATGRTNLSVRLKTNLKGNQEMSHFAYYSKNDYQLFSNFTFYLNDSINGDMIEQVEDRDLFGYTFEYNRTDSIAHQNVSTTFSLGTRTDLVHAQLLSSPNRAQYQTYNNDKIEEVNGWGYVKEVIELTEKTTLEAGLRLDVYSFYQENLLQNTTDNRLAARLSPKASLFHQLNQNIRLFAKSGSGYHSNYTQAAVDDKDIHPLPRAISGDIGMETSSKKVFASAALWSTKSDAEYIFVADAGEFENNGASLRTGADVIIKYQPIKSLWFNLDLNYSYGILLDEPEEANAIPSAPRFTSKGAVNHQTKKGIRTMLSYKYMAKRPLVEDESVYADAYFLLDGSVIVPYKQFEFGFYAQNILNSEWMEAVFYDTSRLSNESTPQEDFHFTAGTPIFLKGSISYLF